MGSRRDAENPNGYRHLFQLVEYLNFIYPLFASRKVAPDSGRCNQRNAVLSARDS